MTKAEMTERLLDLMVDEWTDCPEDYMDTDPIDLDYAKVMLKDLAELEDEFDLDDSERVVHLATPELVREVFNCLVRSRKFEVRVERLAEWIRENNPVCEYSNYYLPEHEDAIDLVPVDFLCDTDGFPFLEREPSPLEMLRIGMNSRKTFDPQEEYCWFDADLMTIHSTNHPFADNILDADAFARFILLDAETFGYMFDDIIDDEDAKHILGCTKEEYINE